MLLYLTLARPSGFHQRDRLVGLFWPALDQEHARAALRKLLHRLRQIAGEDLIEARGSEAIAIAPAKVECDAIDFVAAADQDRLRQALDLYRGELLPSFVIPEGDGFERWLDGERAFYHERAVQCAWELVERYASESELTNATQLARVVARLAPTDERMLRRVMTMLDKLDDRAGAMDVYTKFAARMRREFSLEPSPETIRLADRIRSRPGRD
jgi:DNA-binding SARP family transcriptional activator